MSNIIGEEIEGYVASQIRARQILHGSGANTERNSNQLNVLNSQTSWIKLASGVSVESSRLKEISVDTSFHGMGLAKNNVLFGGTSKVVNNRTVQRDGLQPQNPNSSYTYGEFGYVPMAGITGASIKTLNRGSLKKASVKLKVHDREQFEIIDLLYLRLGYTVLLEWGNSIFTPDGYSKEIVRDTLIDSGNGFFNSGFSSGRSYLDILPQIENYRTKWRGNYDGLLGKVSNFDWSFNEDGSYDINLTIISLGDVIESLKTNISVDKDSSEFLKALEATPEKTTDPPEEDPIEDNKDSNAIAFMLWAWKYTNKGILTDSSKTISIKTPEESHYVSQFLVSSEELSTTEVTYEFTVKKSYYDEGQWESITTTDSKTFIKDDTLYDEVQKEKKKLESVASNSEQKTVTYKKIKKTTSTTQSPISEFGTKDAFAFLVKNEQYYLRFGALLEFLVDKIVPIIDSKPKQVSIFNIDIEQYYNWMYSVPNQVSLDPRVCIVRNSNFIGSGGAAVEIYDQLLPFRAQDYVTDSPNLNKAYIMNIYLNFNFILDSLNSNTDEKGNVNLYNFIVSLCDGVSKALGGVNTLEPIIDETSNTLKIVDTTPIPGVTQDSSSAYTLQLYGYDGVGAGRSRSNFIRKVDLKTAITPEYATMITVGATAGGYVKGTEATAFSRWNKGLIDRFKEEIIPSNPSSQKSNPDGVDEAETNYVTKFLDKYNGKHGIKGNLYGGGSISKCELSSDIIDSNISIVTEYYKLQQSQNKEGGGGTIGFIPFKLGLTMDGLAGIKIYNKLHVNTRFLPSNYGKTLDLIVTGVSHELNNNDWETQIEATVIPKTTESKISAITAEDIKEDIQAVEKATKGATISSCSQLPAQSGLSKSAKKIIKASTTKDSDIVQAIVDNLEGGYYHPTHAFSFKQKDRDIYKNSGETLYGLDRYAGNNEGIRKGPKNQSGVDFWSAVDAISGNGSYKDTSRTVKTGQWNIDKFPKKSGIWSWNHMPKKSEKGYDTLQKNLTKYITSSYNTNMNNNFGSTELKKVIENDGRLKFMFYRATWNGSGFFKKYANNLKAVYNKGERDVEKLICADLTYRYNNKSSAFKPGVSKMAYMIDYNPPQ